MKRSMMLVMAVGLAGCGAPPARVAYAPRAEPIAKATTPPVDPCDPSVTNPHLKRECAARTWAGTLGNWKPTREQQRFMLKECNQTISNYDLAVRCTEIRRLLANKPPTKPTKQEIAEADALAVAGQRQARRDQLAVAQCEYRSQLAFDRSPGFLMPFANANNARTQCLEFYNRNGALPGDPLD